MPCIYIEECDAFVKKDQFESTCMSDTQKYIYCEKFRNIENPSRMPKHWYADYQSSSRKVIK